MPGNNYWRGDAVAVDQVNTITVGGANAAGQVYSVTINSKTVSYTTITGLETNSDIAASLQVLLDASTIPEFTEVDWTVNTNVITATANDTNGKPFTNTSSATGTGTLVTATTTNPTGPNHWDNADNWSLLAVPINGDSVYIRGTATDILYGLSQAGVTLALLDIDSTYTGKIGLPDFATVTGSTGYYEYRTTHLTIGATTVQIGRGDGACSGRVRIDVGTVQCALKVYGTGTPDIQGGYAVSFLGTNASNTLVASRGSVGIADKPGTSATILTAQIGGQTNSLTDVTVLFGDGSTLGTLTMSGGTVTVNNGVTTATVTNGVLTIAGASSVTTLNCDTGTVNYDSSGTIGTYRGGTDSLINFTRVPVNRTVTNSSLEANSGLRDSLKTVTFTNAIAIKCKLGELKELDLGEQFSLQRS